MTNRALALLGLLSSCNSLIQLAPDPLGDLTRIQITPKTADLLIADLSQPPIVQAFHAVGIFSDGARRDITEQLRWNVDNGVPGGFLTPGLFTTTNAASGHVQVIAQGDTVWATAEVTVRLDATIIDGAFPPSDPDLFDNTKPVLAGDPTRSPTLLYPSTNTIFPQTLPNTVFQLARGALNDAFRLTFETDLLHVVVLTGADRWETGAFQNVIAQANIGQQVTVTIDAASSADPGTIYQGSPIAFSFAKDAPDGPLYYWSAATSGIMRSAIGVSSAGKLYPGTGDDTCVGCHTVSRDGTKMAMGYGSEGAAALQTVDVPTLASTISHATLHPMGWATYSPDGALLLIANDGVLVLRDAVSGAPVNSATGKVTLPTGKFATHPEWSPDGAYVAIAYTSTQPTNLDVKAASIARLPFDQATQTFGAPQLVVPATATDNFYFPKYSPDGRVLAFVRATETSKGAMSAELGLVAANGGVISLLANASHLVASSSIASTATQMPSWAPFSGDYAWLAFASKRPYGVVVPSGGRSQIWVSAIDLASYQPGLDPSAAGFYLPAQDPTVVNNSPIWAPSTDPPQ
ncbi:hypothetical protein BH11MYX1_BH11MYX1_24050 [soil metagenome]